MKTHGSRTTSDVSEVILSFTVEHVHHFVIITWYGWCCC